MARSSRGLGHHPLKVAARVRIPYGLPGNPRSEALYRVPLLVSAPCCQWRANVVWLRLRQPPRRSCEAVAVFVGRIGTMTAAPVCVRWTASVCLALVGATASELAGHERDPAIDLATLLSLLLGGLLLSAHSAAMWPAVSSFLPGPPGWSPRHSTRDCWATSAPGWCSWTGPCAARDAGSVRPRREFAGHRAWLASRVPRSWLPATSSGSSRSPRLTGLDDGAGRRAIGMVAFDARAGGAAGPLPWSWPRNGDVGSGGRILARTTSANLACVSPSTGSDLRRSRSGLPPPCSTTTPRIGRHGHHDDVASTTSASVSGLTASPNSPS